jgi:soluble lytic murein transglycosylase-like protein
MPVNVPINADASGVIRQMQQLREVLRSMGADARAFNGIDLSHPELGDLADDLRTVIKNFEQLSRIGRGTTASNVRGIVGRAPEGSTPADGMSRMMKWFEQSQAAYADPGERAGHISRVGAHIFQGTRFAGGGASGGAGGGADIPGGKMILGGLSDGLKAVGKEFLPALLAAAGIKAVGAMAAQGIGQAQGEAASNDALMRTIQGSASDFDALRQSVRDATKGLYLTFQEGQQLSQQFAKLTNETDPAKISAGVRTAAGLARSYGLDPAATTATFGAAQYLNENPRDFADLIAAAVQNGGMTGQGDQVSQAILSWIQQSSRQMVTGNSAGAFASMYAAMNASGVPGLKGDAGISILNSANGAITGGGGGGMAGQVALLQAFSDNGISDPYKSQYLFQGGLFATPNSMGIAGARDGNLTNFAAARNKVDAMYRDPYMRATALGQMFNITAPQASALDQINPADLNSQMSYLNANGITPNPTAMQDIFKVLGGPSSGLQDWRKRLLATNSGYNVSGADQSALMGAQGNDALKLAVVQALNDSGMSQTIGTQSQQSMADYSNNLTAAGATLLPAVVDLRQSMDALTQAVASLAQTLGGAASNASTSVANSGLSGVILPRFGSASAAQRIINNAVGTAASGVGLDPTFMQALARQESSDDQSKVSSAGAIGVMQLMPGTAQGMGINPNNAGENIRGGIAYFQQLLAQFGGNYDVAAAAYNAGPNNAGVKYFASSGDPSQLPPESFAYVAAIEARAQAAGLSLASLHLRADPIVFVLKNPNGQVIGKAQANLQANGKAVPKGVHY